MFALLKKPQSILIFVTLLWGSTFVVTKHVLAQNVPPILYVVSRYWLGAILMILLCFLREKHSRGWLLWKGLGRRALILGTLQAIGITLQVFGQDDATTPASKSAFLTAFSVPLTPVLAWLFYKDRPRFAQAAALAIGVMGMLLLTYPAQGVSFQKRDILTLLCALVYGIITVLTVHWATRQNAYRLAAAQSLIAAITLLVFLVVVHTVPGKILYTLRERELLPWSLSWPLVLEWLYMSVVCISFTFSAQNWAMSQLGATEAALILSSEPIFTTVLGVMVFGRSELPQTHGLMGAALIFLAVIGGELSWKRKK